MTDGAMALRPMDTAEALKKAMQAVKDAGIPEELWSTALPLALADLRGTAGAPSPTDEKGSSGGASGGNPSTKRSTKRSAKKSGQAPNGSPASTPSVLSGLPDQADLFEKVSKETGVSVGDLGDVFHVEDGELELKIISKNLGENKRAAMMNVTALLGGVVFGGTAHTKVPFKDINAICKAKHCHDSGNGSANIKATPGFAAVGSGFNQALTSKTGWQDAFSEAVDAVLGRNSGSS